MTFQYNLSQCLTCEIRYVLIGMLVEWKKPVWSSDGVDWNGSVSTMSELVSIAVQCRPSEDEKNQDSPQAFTKVRKVSSLRSVAAMMNSLMW